MDFLQDHYSVQNELLLIFISVILGLLIGAEREYRNKSAGLRTFILVCFGSCLFTILSIKIGVQNPDRIAANIITGIGFLGAGVIFKGDSKIDGITTATTIWATASIGMAVGSGYVYFSLLGTALVLLVLNSLSYLQNFIDNNHKIREYKISISASDHINHCEELFRNNHLKFLIIRQQYSHDSLTTTWRLTGNYKQHELLIRQMMNDPKIMSYQF
ncbi:magnesium transporter MgtC [Chryseobacterium piperi]|uniref:Magnesium transporter MgtC n=1 Tax=Chryseobacterium piperi TaxID=558152 RepID=A0A086BKZ0_9FLAO|nr:MgtC/SapB family protein [Chryseobacterium piperi]ASW74444.1 magnesium transporter MgtC [Chryseobacterium piperi]KFF29604.1 magnesium transporter MgtC [Chryseobacterium piperi]